MVADVGLHRHLDAVALLEFTFDGVAGLALLEHDSDAGDALSPLRHELRPQVRPFERLEELEVHCADVHLCAAQGVVDIRSSKTGVVVDRGNVVEDLPGRPAERPVVLLDRLVEVAHGERDLGDRVMQPT